MEKINTDGFRARLWPHSAHIRAIWFTLYTSHMIDPRVKSNTTSSAVLSSQRRGQRSCSRTTPSGLSSHIQIPPGTFCSVSSSYLKNVYFFFLSFSRQIGVLYSSRFARSPPHLQNVKDLKARIKGTFLINTFFSLSASFFLKAVFHYF